MSIIIDLPNQKKIKDGAYLATLKDVKEFKSKYGQAILFIFDIIEPGYETRVTGICSKIIRSPKSKLFRWALALGADLTKPQLDLSTLIGRNVIVVVTLYKSNDGFEYLNVIDLRKAENIGEINQNNVKNVIDNNLQHLKDKSNVQNNNQQQQVQYQQQSQVQYQHHFYQNKRFNQQYDYQQQNSNLKNDQFNQNINIETKKNPLIEEIKDLDELEF